MPFVFEYAQHPKFYCRCLTAVWKEKKRQRDNLLLREENRNKRAEKKVKD